MLPAAGLRGAGKHPGQKHGAVSPFFWLPSLSSKMVVLREEAS